MDYRIGTRIVLDEDKIRNEGIYDLDEIYKHIDELANHAGLIKKNKYTYICQGNGKDLAVMGIFNIQNLLEQEWFTKNVKEWIWIDRKEGDTDMKEYYKRHNEGVWV